MNSVLEKNIKYAKTIIKVAKRYVHHNSIISFGDYVKLRIGNGCSVFKNKNNKGSSLYFSYNGSQVFNILPDKIQISGGMSINHKEYLENDKYFNAMISGEIYSFTQDDFKDASFVYDKLMEILNEH